MTNDERVNILIVDDSPTKLLAMSAALGSLNQNIVTAPSGREALRHLLNQDFAVIVLDVHMPDVDGFETAALIRQRQSSAHVPIIFVTAYADDTHASQGYSLGAVDFLLTPVVPEVLRAKVSVFVELFRRKLQIQAQADERIALAQEQAARRTAEAANHMKDEFLATLSHELRTPLNSILGWAQLLKMGNSTEEDLMNGLEVIERNAKAQAKIIEDLLDVSRIISGKLELETRPVSLVDLVDASVEAAQLNSISKGLTFERHYESDMPLVCVDSTRFQQVVWNLLSNAVKFTPDGGQIDVAVKRLDRAAEISVSDTGDGIAPEFLPFVFERFRQADASTARRHGGLGIGLAIVRQLVEMHGGQVQVFSRGHGQGTTFRVRIPTIDSPAAASSIPDAGKDNLARLPMDPQPSLLGIRVMVVDDEQDAREFVRKLLTQCNADVVEASCTKDALNLLETYRPDVLVSDIGMPDADGYALIRELRSRPDGVDIPAIALTAYARPEERRHALAAGFQMHIAKPLDPNELVGAIKSLASRADLPLEHAFPEPPLSSTAAGTRCTPS
jgi:signal transduction histidine kinase